MWLSVSEQVADCMLCAGVCEVSEHKAAALKWIT